MKHLSAFSSKTHTWQTPPDLFDKLNREFRFTLDAAASADNALASEYFTEDDDALSQRWHGRVFCNPPYGPGIGKWVKKCYEEAQAGALVVALIPARTDTDWWHRYVMWADEVRLIRGRLRFSGAPNSAPFPSCIVVFGTGERRAEIFAVKRDGGAL